MYIYIVVSFLLKKTTRSLYKALLCIKFQNKFKNPKMLGKLYVYRKNIRTRL